MIPETQHSKSPGPQPGIARGIFQMVIGVLSAIQLDNNPTFKANKIHYVRAQGLLSPELEAIYLTPA
jgi:hypothetical protein